MSVNYPLKVGPSDISHCCSCWLTERFQNVHRRPGHHICHGSSECRRVCHNVDWIPCLHYEKKKILLNPLTVISSSNLGPNVILNKNNNNIFQGIFLPFLLSKEKWAWYLTRGYLIKENRSWKPYLRATDKGLSHFISSNLHWQKMFCWYL